MRTDIIQVATKSVSSPSAQYTTLSQPGNTELRALRSWTTSIMVDKTIPPLLKAFICLLLDNGLRVSEMIGIGGMDIGSDGTVLIKSKKKSHNRFVYPIQHREVFERLSGQPVYPLREFSRFYFYRLFKKKGIYTIHEDGSKTSVTHAARELYIKKLHNLSGDMEAVQRDIGHKSQNSTKHYVQKR